MLYSIGKDSSVLLHLLLKAFYPAKPPLPMMHIDTTWQFREMIAFRDNMAATLGFDLLVHTNEEGRQEGINPFDQWGVELGKAVASRILPAIQDESLAKSLDASTQGLISFSRKHL